MVSTYGDVLRPARREAALFYDVMLVLAGSLLIALTAQVSFNIGPVPITGQTFGVLLVAALLGSKRGGAAVLAYLVEGASGLPFFAGGVGGAAVFAGPTGGYLVGFLPAALLVGWLAERGWDRRFALTLVAMILGNLVIYSFGVPYLRSVLSVSWSDAFAFGLTPFVVGDLFKVVAAAILLPTGWKLLNRTPSP